MAKPSAPPPPDPRAVAGAQTTTNIGTAIANTATGNVNQVTPHGTLTYDQTGTHVYKDPNTGDEHKIPTYTATTKYTQDQNHIFKTNEKTQQTLAAIASQAATRMGSFLKGNVDRSKLPTVQRAPNRTPRIVGPAASGKVKQFQAPNQRLQGSIANAGRIPAGALNAGGIKSSGLSRRKLDYSDGQEGGLQTGVSGAGDGLTQRGGGTSDVVQGGVNKSQFQQKIGNVRGVDRTDTYAGEIQDSVRSSDPLTDGVSGGQISQRGGNTSGLRTGGVADVNMQRHIDGTMAFDRSAADGGDLQSSYGGNFSKDRNEVEDALMGRMNRQFDRDRAALETRLANQGITPGSEAYQNAMGDLERNVADARMGAILSAGQEQSRMVGMERDRAQFANQAQAQQFQQSGQNIDRRNALQAQQFGQNAQRGQFFNNSGDKVFDQRVTNESLANQAQQQRFNQGMANSRFANEAQAQGFNQNLASRSLQNAALGQRFNQDLAAMQAGNQAQNQLFSQGMSNRQMDAGLQQQQYSQEADRARFTNDVRANQFGQNLANRQQDNAAQQQRFDQRMQNSQFGNAAQQQGFNQRLAAGNFANAAQQQGFSQDVANTKLNNATALQDFNMRMQNRNMENAAQQQKFDQMATQRQLGTAAQQQQFNQNLASAQFANQAQQQGLQSAIAGNAAANAAQQQQYDQNRTSAIDKNNNLGTRFNQNMAIQQSQQNWRNQMLSESLQLRNQPINEITALLSGSQIQAPNFSVNSPAPIPTTDYAGIVNQGYANQLGAYGQQMGAWNNIMGGLGGLGASLIMGSDRRLKRDVRRIGSRRGLNLYEYRYVWDRPGVKRRGYMAQEVAEVRPDAVKRFGQTMALDYSKLPEVA